MSDGRRELRWLRRAKAVAAFARKNTPEKCRRTVYYCLKINEILGLTIHNNFFDFCGKPNSRAGVTKQSKTDNKCLNKFIGVKKEAN